MMLKILKIIAFALAFSVFSLTIFAQKKPRKPLPKTPSAVKVKTPESSETLPVDNSVKKNERPAEENAVEKTDGEPQKSNQNLRKNERPAQKNDDFQPVYHYEFSQPNFIISKIIIEHDEAGKGKISFMKQGFEEIVSDPIQLSAATLEKLKNAFQTVNYLASGENYQYEKDYSHLGNIEIKVKKDGQEYSTKFNYTTNKDAKTLADEYRRIGQQFIWIFDMNVARVNQPLNTPGLVDLLDSYFARNEISDPEQMTPFLKELSNDERLPLIARNRSTKLIQKIEKAKH